MMTLSPLALQNAIGSKACANPRLAVPTAIAAVPTSRLATSHQCFLHGQICFEVTSWTYLSRECLQGSTAGRAARGEPNGSLPPGGANREVAETCTTNPTAVTARDQQDHRPFPHDTPSSCDSGDSVRAFAACATGFFATPVNESCYTDVAKSDPSCRPDVRARAQPTSMVGQPSTTSTLPSRSVCSIVQVAGQAVIFVGAPVIGSLS